MISKIELNNVPSYKEQAVLETDKKVNLIYGLNGTGKTILSNVLYKPEENEGCIITGFEPDNETMLVYNQKFIEDNFFESEEQNGIFTLSRENKETRKKINGLNEEIQNLNEQRKEVKEKLNTKEKSLKKSLEEAKNVVWNIKKDYTRGDRVLEYCLEGFKNSQDKLFTQLRETGKPIKKPKENTEFLKVKLQSISGDNAKKLDKLSKIIFSSPSVETETLLSKQIVGNENSTISQLIKKLKNDDWVKEGVEYLPKEPIKENASCPFCQEKTISNKLRESIESYFDTSYEDDINSLKRFSNKYSLWMESISEIKIFEKHPKFEENKQDLEIFKSRYKNFINIVKGNKGKIENKINAPSKSVRIENPLKPLRELNEIIQKINNLVATHNEDIDNLVAIKDGIKRTFWQIMRWDYDQTITKYKKEEDKSTKEQRDLNKEIKKYDREIGEKEKDLSVLYGQTQNIQEAINNINGGLSNLGITNFKIVRARDNMYKITRGQGDENVFPTLSEGEKMIISFLYFIEQCRGKKEATETKNKKIIVIDDPISSLSHIYVFNISQLIDNEFFNSKQPNSSNYEQVFILTHSLYFFNELIDWQDKKKNDRKKKQKLFTQVCHFG